MKARNCAWLDANNTGAKKAVWARGGVITYQCPKSLITEYSYSLLEHFRIWKEFGGGVPWSMDAKSAEAVLLLEQEWRKEKQNGQNG